MAEREVKAPHRVIAYADETARISYEVAAAVRRLDASLPPDDFSKPVTLVPIEWEPQDALRGEAALFFADDFMEISDDERTYFIRPRTRVMLDSLGVRYHVVPSPESTSIMP